MKIVAISDTHREYNSLVVPDGDVLIHAGDVDIMNINDLIVFNRWLGKMPHRHKLFVAGNHDLALEEMTVDEIQKVLTNATYLYNAGIVIDGLRFWGSPFTPLFNDWAFMKPREKMGAIWKKIPDKTNVLITHGPAYKTLDSSKATYWDSVGCWALQSRIDKLKHLKAHIFGHIHEGHGNDEKSFNVSVMDEEYCVSFEPTIIEV